MDEILLQSNGKPWLTDKDKTVPKKCPICGAKMIEPQESEGK